MEVVQGVLFGIAVLLAGTIPRNVLFAANLRYYQAVAWAAPLMIACLWFLWRYLKRAGPDLRANPLAGAVWARALLAGGLGIVALVVALRVANRLVVLPQQHLPDLTTVPENTVFFLLKSAAPIAGIVEEAAFRGYMQGPIARRFGLTAAILLTGTIFAIVHLDFTPILWPYYVTVAAIYGTVTHLTNSILPAVALHTAGNLYSNLDLWLHGHAEWQAPSGAATLIWKTGVDVDFWRLTVTRLIVVAAVVWSYLQLAWVTRGIRRGSPPDASMSSCAI